MPIGNNAAYANCMLYVAAAAMLRICTCIYIYFAYLHVCVRVCAHVFTRTLSILIVGYYFSWLLAFGAYNVCRKLSIDIKLSWTEAGNCK